MPKSANMPSELLNLCTAWSSKMEKLTAKEARIEFIQKHLPELLHNSGLFIDLVKRITKGEPYPDILHTDAVDNEILLYLDSRRIFSIRMFIFGAGEFTPIHDHNSWGVTGTALNELTVVKYHRDDDGAMDGYAKIHETKRLTLLPGDIELTLPLTDGIHKTGNSNEDPVIMVSIYGSPIRRLYFNGFDAEKNRIFRMYAPKIKKKQLARKTMEYLSKRSR